MEGLPAALVLVTLIVCSTFLTWKGVLPSHAFFMVAGAAVTWAVPKAAQIFSQRASSSGRSGGSFPPEEIPTKKDLRSEAVTVVMPKVEKDKIEEGTRTKKMSDDKVAEAVGEVADPKDVAQEKLKAEGVAPGLFQHYKGPRYEVLGTSIDEETLEPLVHYRSLAHGTLWTRTIKNFIEQIEVDGNKVSRFARVVPTGFFAKIWAWMKAHLTNSWMASNDFDATMAHVGWACLISLATLILSIATRMPIPHAALLACGWCSAALVVFALVKEYGYDANFEEPPQDFRANTIDVLGYLGGLALAWIVIGLSLLLGH